MHGTVLECLALYWNTWHCTRLLDTVLNACQYTRMPGSVLWRIWVSGSCMGCPPLLEIHCIHPNLPTTMVIMVLNITMMNETKMPRASSTFCSALSPRLSRTIFMHIRKWNTHIIGREFEQYKIRADNNSTDKLSDQSWIYPLQIEEEKKDCTGREEGLKHYACHANFGNFGRQRWTQSWRYPWHWHYMANVGNSGTSRWTLWWHPWHGWV